MPNGIGHTRIGPDTRVLIFPSALIARWHFFRVGSYSPASRRSGELMNALKLSIFILLGLTAVARAEPSTEANLAIKADLAKAQLALAQHNISAAVDTLDDTVKYLPNADEQTLQALIEFQKRVRENLDPTTTRPTLSSSPDLPGSAPSPPDQVSAPDQSSPGSFQEQPVPAPAAAASPPGPKLSVNATSLPADRAAPARKSEPKVTRRWARPRAQQPPRLAEAAKPSLAHAVAVSRPEPVPQVQTAPTSSMRTEVTLKLLGYYAQNEDGKWVWLPAGSGDGPPR